MKVFVVYILKCSDGTYYTGMTSNLEQRLVSHEEGRYKDSYTYFRRPVQLVFQCEFTEVNHAITTEKQLKKWSKAKKEALIMGESDILPKLAKKLFR